jgi:Tfp pilus assembly protein PilW
MERMAYMITSITRINSAGLAFAGRRLADVGKPSAAFTLVEVLIGSALGSMVLAGVLSSFLMVGRTSLTAANYSLAETELRRGIEEFSRDVRMASAIVWTSASSITLTVPDNYTANSNQVTYVYDSSTSGSTSKTFYRVPGGSGSTATRTVFVHEVSSFSFSRFNRLNNAATTDAETKRIRITMNVKRTSPTLVAANTSLVSASYTLRNKVIN